MRWAITAVFAMAVLILADLPLGATPPCVCPDSMLWEFPYPNATEVPTNVHLFLSWKGLQRDTLKLEELNNDKVAVTEVKFTVEETVGQVHQIWIIPEEELKAKTTYRLTGTVSESSIEVAFSTGDGPDNEAPAFDSAEVKGSLLPDACSDHLSAQIIVSGLKDNQTKAEDIILKAEVKDGAVVRTVLMPGNMPYFGITTGSNADFKDCLIGFPTAKTGIDYKAKVTALDWAGNASVSSPESTFQFTKGKSMYTDCGCHFGSTELPSPAPLLILLVPWVILRLRKRFMCDPDACR